MGFSDLESELISMTPPREFLDKNFTEAIPYNSQRRHVVNVMEKRLKLKTRPTFDWKSMKLNLPYLVGTTLDSTFRKSIIIGDTFLWIRGYFPEVLVNPESDVGMQYYLQLGQSAYGNAYKAGRKSKGNLSDVVLFDELADNYKNLVRAIFEFKLRFLPPNKNLAERVLRKMDAVLYHGELFEIYPILHGRSFEKPTILH